MSYWRMYNIHAVCHTPLAYNATLQFISDSGKVIYVLHVSM